LDTFKTGHVILGKYEVVDVLGKGGMGRILAARDLKLDRLVALKFLLPALCDKPDLVSRFEREARTAARIQNPHVATVYGVDAVDGAPFIVMECLSGRDLSAVIRERGQLPIAEAADLLLQACEAVAEAHALGIVHRDLKPGNLFLTETPDRDPVLKVLDFGISKTTTADDVSLTAGTAMLGSPVYMSPEQFEAARSVDARSDVWSLGVVLYEMLTGTVPFKGDTIPNVWAAIRRGRYAELSSCREDIPPALERMLSETLVVDRKRRLPSVEAFASRLAPFGTDAARATFEQIHRIGWRAKPVSRAVEKSAAIDWPVGTGAETKDTAGALARSQAPTLPASRRWVGWSAFGAMAGAAAVFGILAHRGAFTRSTRSAASAAPGVPIGAAEAACERGDGAACNSAGQRYALGEGVTKDERRAFERYKRACDLKLAVGCVNLGSLLFDGDGVLKDETLGAHLFSQGCEAGVPKGCWNLSVAYARGRGVPKDPTESFAYAERACTGGARVGCVGMAVARLTGEGVTKDVKGGLTELDAMCRQGETAACEMIISLYAKGLGTDIPADTLRSRTAAAKGCDGGSETACKVEALLAAMDSAAIRTAQANALSQRKCDQGDLVGCAMLGKNLVDGIGTRVDRVKGTALLQRACEGHVPEACEKLAPMAGR
jgi:serine/threonine-protein kinase